MELLLFRPKDFTKLYGCDGFNASQVPLSNRTNVVNGSLLILLFVLFEILYIPCMMSIYKNIDTACYKLLFFIGILDMLVIFMNGLETGILGIIGAVFCDYPILIYTSGSVGLALWYAETGVELLLAINRCMEVLRPSMAHAIFSGNKAWYLCAVPIVYSTVLCLYTEPILFSGIYFSWFFNPYVGYVDDFGQIYHSTPHTVVFVHDCFVIFGLSAIYLSFSVMLVWRTYSFSSNQLAHRPTWTQKMTFLQVVIISFFNAVCSGIYILMQFIRISQIYIIIGTYTWLFAHGCPPIVYLLLNVRIRKDFANFVRAILRRPWRGHAVAYALNTTAWVNSGTNANEVVQQGRGSRSAVGRQNLNCNNLQIQCEQTEIPESIEWGRPIGEWEKGTVIAYSVKTANSGVHLCGAEQRVMDPDYDCGGTGDCAGLEGLRDKEKEACACGWGKCIQKDGMGTSTCCTTQIHLLRHTAPTIETTTATTTLLPEQNWRRHANDAATLCKCGWAKCIETDGFKASLCWFQYKCCVNPDQSFKLIKKNTTPNSSWNSARRTNAKPQTSRANVGDTDKPPLHRRRNRTGNPCKHLFTFL